MAASEQSVSEAALRVLDWLVEIEQDPARRASMATGALLIGQAAADGVCRDAGELAPLVGELIEAGYLAAEWMPEQSDRRA